MKFSDVKNKAGEDGSSDQEERLINDLSDQDANAIDQHSKEAESDECTKWELMGGGGNRSYLERGREIRGQVWVDVRQCNDQLHLKVLVRRREDEEWRDVNSDAVPIIKLKRESSQRKLFKGDRALVLFDFDVRVGEMRVPSNGKEEGVA